MKPVWDGSEFVPRLMLPLSLSYDHRVIDGAAAARFCAHLAGVLADLRQGAAVSVRGHASPTSATSPTSRSIEILVAAGDEVAAEDPLVMLESDKATMESRRRGAGTVAELRVERRRQGLRGHARSLTLDGRRTPRRRRRRRRAEPAAARGRRPPPAAAPSAATSRRRGASCSAPGPGGYTAAFRAADLGLEVVLVERYERSAASA